MSNSGLMWWTPDVLWERISRPPACRLAYSFNCRAATVTLTMIVITVPAAYNILLIIIIHPYQIYEL